MKLLKKKKLMIFVLLTIVITVTLIVIPYPPIRPRNIPLDDYSYTIKYAEYELDKHNLPSTAVSLLDGDNIVYQRVTGFSNIEEEYEADDNTVYKAGSISKLFTAIEIMRLYEEGLVDLDAPITTYLPDFSISSRFNDTEPITIRNILSHRSGLPRNGNLPLWAWDNTTYVMRDLVASLEESNVAYPANYRFKYSNIGYNILGRIIEVVRGEWFAIYMRDSLLHPIGMTSSGFVSSLIPYPSRIAVGYFKDGKNYVPYNQYDMITMASGGLYTTIEDMNAFAKFIFNKGKVNDVQIINETTLSMMFKSEFAKPTDPQKVGFGFFLDNSYLPNNEQIVFHAGTNQGTKSMIVLVPELKLSVTLFSNAEEFEDISKSLALEIIEIMHETKTGIKKQIESYEIRDIAPTILQNYTGFYAVEGDIAEVFLAGDDLKMNYYGYKIDLNPINETTFVVTHWFVNAGDIKVKFFADYLILSVEGVHNPICPIYLPDQELLSYWSSFLGNYEMWQRHYSIHTGEEIPDYLELQLIDGVLRFSWNNFILQPLSQTELLIQGGPFDGELMFRIPETGFIYWQNRVFHPI